MLSIDSPNELPDIENKTTDDTYTSNQRSFIPACAPLRRDNLHVAFLRSCRSLLLTALPILASLGVIAATFFVVSAEARLLILRGLFAEAQLVERIRRGQQVENPVVAHVDCRGLSNVIAEVAPGLPTRPVVSIGDL